MDQDKPLIRKIAERIYEDTYGRGHGKEMTVTKFISVLELSEQTAYELFDAIHSGE